MCVCCVLIVLIWFNRYTRGSVVHFCVVLTLSQTWKPQMLQNLEQHPQAAQSFYQTYFTDILMQIFSVVTDTSHTASLQNHATILAYMFSLVEAGRITVSLGPSADNVLNVQEYVATLLKSAFNHLTDNQIKIFVTGLFNLDQDVHAFKEHLRDFLIQIKVGSASACYVECR